MPCPDRFKESPVEFQVDEQTITQINDGYEDITSKTPKKAKAAYFKRAVDILTNQTEPEKMQELLEWNACCKSGSRLKASKAFAKENVHNTLDEKLAKIKSVPYMGKPVRNEDGTITVAAVEYYDGEKYLCSCSNFNKLKYDYSISRNYCFCCAGHFKFHYEIMLGVKLKTLEIVSSPLDSKGKNPCIIKFAIQ